MKTQDILSLLRAESPMNIILHKIIEDNAYTSMRRKRLYDEYTGDVPILSRQYEYNAESKINERLPHDFRGYIVDNCLGYLFGMPITYSLDKRGYASDQEYESAYGALKKFRIGNSLADLDAETGKIASICGTASRLLYVLSGTTDVRIMSVYPWETVFIRDPSLDEPQYAMRYYDYEVYEGINKERTVTHVEWYDRENYTEYETQADGTFAIVKGPLPHLFYEVPLIEFPNNEERQGDFEKVSRLIDGYDNLVSDVQSELEEFRQAYLVSIGAELGADVVKEARQTGAFNLPEPNSSLTFLVKAIQDGAVENHKKTLVENIHKFSKSVDMSDEKFSGSAESGESRKWKLLALENKAIVKERKFKKGLRRQMNLLSRILTNLGTKIEDDAISYSFSRNIPIELSHEASVLVQLHGHVSEDTRLGLASFIDDVQKEKDQMEDDMKATYPVKIEDEEDEEVEE